MVCCPIRVSFDLKGGVSIQLVRMDSRVTPDSSKSQCSTPTPLEGRQAQRWLGPLFCWEEMEMVCVVVAASGSLFNVLSLSSIINVRRHHCSDPHASAS